MKVGSQMEKILNAKPVFITIPFGTESHFAGVIDILQMNLLLFEKKSLGANLRTEKIPEEFHQEAFFYREKNAGDIDFVR